MSKPRTIISGIGIHGENIVNRLNKQGLLDADFINHNQLIDDHSKNIFILFIIYFPEDNCIGIVDDITRLFMHKTVIEIIITDKIKRQNPYYIINNSQAALKEISTLIKAFTDLGRFPSQASIDMADIIDSLKNAGKLQMKELIFEAEGDFDVFSKLFFLQENSHKIKTLWVQIYLQENNNLLHIILKKLLDAIRSILDTNTNILWNVKYDDLIVYKKDKCVIIFC